MEWHPNLWPPFTQISSSSPPQRVTNAKGAILNIENSPPLIDAISSWWVTLHGHSNPVIADAVYKQAQKLEQVIFADFTHPQAELLAQRLAEATGLTRLFFSDNGSTAVEVAIKIAYQWWQNIEAPRQQIIAFEGAYHGDTFGAMALGERNIFNSHFEKMLFPVKRLSWPNTWWGDLEIENKENQVLDELEKLLETNTAAVIIEPLLQGAGGMACVRSEFLQGLEKRVKAANSLLIVDEVLTGFGRCGSLFAFQRADLKPDLIALSKGLTGGFLPMGATMVSEKIFKNFIGTDPRLTFWHGHSFTANPLGCAAANASLDLLEENPNKFLNFEARHLPYLKDISNHPKVRRPRLIGTVAAFELQSKEDSGYLNLSGKILKDIAMQEGVFIRPLGNVVYLMPPLCITDKELEQCYAALKYGLDKI